MFAIKILWTQTTGQLRIWALLRESSVQQGFECRAMPCHVPALVTANRVVGNEEEAEAREKKAKRQVRRKQLRSKEERKDSTLADCNKCGLPASIVSATFCFLTHLYHYYWLLQLQSPTLLQKKHLWTLSFCQRSLLLSFCQTHYRTVSLSLCILTAHYNPQCLPSGSCV